MRSNLNRPFIALTLAAFMAVPPTETAEDFMSRLAHDKNLQRYTSREIPFSATTKLALQRAVEEADEVRHTAIRPEHLLLALLRDESSQRRAH
jgi:ATP-dependent Clp protease ATP-binding subunit ClpA